jgi:UPF0716 family protein affecting phage T7 exclusion
VNKQHIEKLKFIGGALIVGAAALIMLPGFVNLAAGLGRILLIIVLAGSICLALAYGTRFVMRSRKTEQSPVSAPSDTEPNSL